MASLKFTGIFLIIFSIFCCAEVTSCKRKPVQQSHIKPTQTPKWEPNETGLRTIQVQMGNQRGDGMDGGFMRNRNWGGGRFNFQFCFLNTNQCCQTGNLDTDDDNWEKGHVNYFVGRQIDACENFPLHYNGNFLGYVMLREPDTMHANVTRDLGKPS